MKANGNGQACVLTIHGHQTIRRRDRTTHVFSTPCQVMPNDGSLTSCSVLQRKRGRRAVAAGSAASVQAAAPDSSGPMLKRRIIPSAKALAAAEALAGQAAALADGNSATSASTIQPSASAPSAALIVTVALASGIAAAASKSPDTSCVSAQAFTAWARTAPNHLHPRPSALQTRSDSPPDPAALHTSSDVLVPHGLQTSPSGTLQMLAVRQHSESAWRQPLPAWFEQQLSFMVNVPSSASPPSSRTRSQLQQSQMPRILPSAVAAAAESVAAAPTPAAQAVPYTAALEVTAGPGEHTICTDSGAADSTSRKVHSQDQSVLSQLGLLQPCDARSQSTGATLDFTTSNCTPAPPMRQLPAHIDNPTAPAPNVHVTAAAATRCLVLRPRPHMS